MRLPGEFRDRTKGYASAVVRLYSKLPTKRREVEVMGHQLLRSATSVAAQTREASRARSSAEFIAKIEGALQEADESQLWLELLRDDRGITSAELAPLLSETDELIAILTTIATKSKRNP